MCFTHDVNDNPSREINPKRIRRRTQDQGQGRRHTPERQELVVIRVRISGTTWAVEANDRLVTNVLSGPFTPQAGEVYEARHIGRAWQLHRKVSVKNLPHRILHPRYPALSAKAKDIVGPNIFQIGDEKLIPEEIDPVSLVNLWSIDSPDDEKDYLLSILDGRSKFPGVKIYIRPELSERLSLLTEMTTGELKDAIKKYDDAKTDWMGVESQARSEWIKIIDQAESEVREINRQKNEFEKEIASLEVDYREITAEIREAKIANDQLEKDRNELTNQIRLARERLNAEEIADQNPRARLRERTALTDEVEAIKIAQGLLASRFDNPIPLIRLHVALKHAPFTVLTGPSGAGKTSLVHQYARALGIHVTTVAVQPNWTSVQDLHGYIDPLEGKQYRGTPYSHALQTQVNYAAVDDFDAPLDLVLLDEINLAYVEYFLSDYLSAFETIERQVQLATRDEIEGLEDSSYSWLKRGKGLLQVPRSFIIAGTANEDHTTRAFSDKFRDRSAFLLLPPPDIDKALDGPEQAVDGDSYVTRAAWEGWLNGVKAEEREIKTIRDLAKRLTNKSLPFSVRVFQRALKQFADANRLLTSLRVSGAEAYAFDLAVSLSVAPKYAPLLLGRESEDMRRSFRAALDESGTGEFTREVLDRIWSTAKG